jgi:hypothetical protein
MRCAALRASLVVAAGEVAAFGIGRSVTGLKDRRISTGPQDGLMFDDSTHDNQMNG